MQDLVYELRRIHLLRRWMNKDKRKRPNSVTTKEEAMLHSLLLGFKPIGHVLDRSATS